MKVRGNRSLAVLALLALGGCATSAGMVRTELQATLTGQQQTPGPGDLDATGTAQVRVDGANGRICWELNVRGMGAATSAGVHRGAAGIAGPVVAPLTTPNAAGRSEGCVPVAPELAREVALQWQNFYVAVAAAAHPQGAVRGQLRGGVIRQQRQSVRR